LVDLDGFKAALGDAKRLSFAQFEREVTCERIRALRQIADCLRACRVAD
jgi:hypothetical protein